MSDTNIQPPTRRASPGRIIAIVAGAATALLATAFLAAGGLVLWADGKKDADGYLTTASKPFTTSTYAIATDDLDVDAGSTDWFTSQDSYGKIRLKVKPRGDTPVFVGIAPSRDVSAYLSDSAHSAVTDVDFEPFRADYRAEGGTKRPAPPAAQGFWAASAHGSGTQTLTWDVRHGSWSVVVMNADGSAGVDARVSAGADVPVLDTIGWVALGGGLFLLVVAGALLFVGVRPRGPRAPEPHQTAVAA
jgi:hypothetical protein